MKKFLAISLNFVLIVAIVCSFTFGFMWNSERKKEPVVDDNSAIVYELQERIKTIEEQLREANFKFENEKQDKLTLMEQKKTLLRQVEDLEWLLEREREEGNVKDETIEAFEQQINSFKFQIETLESKLSIAEQEALASKLTPVEFSLTAEQVSTVFEKTVTIDPPDSHGNTERVETCTVSSYLQPNGVAGRFKSVKEAYVAGDDLVLITDWTLATGTGSRLSYSRIAFEQGSNLIENLTPDMFLQKVETDFNNGVETVNLRNRVVFMDASGYSKMSTTYAKTIEYVASHQDSEFEIYGHKLGINDFYFTPQILSTSTDDMSYFRYNIMFYINEKPVVYLDIPVCMADEAPTSADERNVMLLEAFRVKD